MEVEAKFALTDKTAVQKLKDVESIGSLTLSTARLIRLRDTYLDTSDRHLLASGYVCRKRRIGRSSRLLLTAKEIQSTSTAIHARQEFEIILQKDSPISEWPDSPVRTLVLQMIGDRPLQTLFQLYQTRTTREVLKGDTPIAEWSVDEVRLHVGNRMIKFAELEIELKPAGTKEELEHLTALVQTTWNLAPATQSKFERALAWLENVSAAPPKRRRLSKIRSSDTIAEAARKTLLLHWERMLSHETGAREGKDIEEVHDMRVATRRMRAALRIFDEFLDPDDFNPFAKMLRRTARLLGAVRDLDVFHSKTQHYLATLPDERKTELDVLLAAWQTEYQRARSELIAWLDSDIYNQFKHTFSEFLNTPGAGTKKPEARSDVPSPQRVRDVLPIILLRSWAMVQAYDEAVLAPDVPLALLHQLRIASKGLRYTLEFFEVVLSPSVKLLLDPIKQLQDHLGNLQDAVVACGHLRDFLTWGEWHHTPSKLSQQPPTLIVAPGVAAYLAVRQSEIETLIQTFPQIWAPIRDRNFKKRLFALLAEL